MISLMTVKEFATFLQKNQISWTGRIKRQNLDKSFRWAVDEDMVPSELVLQLKNNNQAVVSINVSRFIVQYNELSSTSQGQTETTKYKDYSDKWFLYQKQLCINDTKKIQNFKLNLQNEYISKRSRILTEYQNDLTLAKEKRDTKILKLDEQYEKFGINTTAVAIDKSIVSNKIYTKIYMENGNLVLENCGKQIKGINVPSVIGKRNCGPIVIGKNHIAISNEECEVLKFVIENSAHTNEDFGDIAIYLSSSKQIVFCWKGPNKLVINPNNLHGIEIGYGDIKPNLNLLDNLVILPNNKVQEIQFRENYLTK